MTDADFAEGSHIYMINADGSGFMQLDDFAGDLDDYNYFSSIGFSEDSGMVAFRLYRQGSDSVYTFDWDSESFTEIISGIGSGCYVSPDFSKLAIFNYSTESIHIMDSNSGSETEIAGSYETNNIHIDSSRVWSPDSSRITYVVNKWIEADADSGMHSDFVAESIYLVDVASCTQTKIAEPNSKISSLQWSADSSNVYYIAGNGEESVDLCVIGADGSGGQKIAEDIDSQYDISPDGRRILYRTESTYYVMNADGSNKTELFDFVGYSSCKWSPDSSEIAYIVRVEDNYYGDLYVMNADGSNRRKLTGYEDTGVVLYEWSPDSDRIYYVRAGNISSGSWSDRKSDIYVISSDRTYFARLTDYWDDEEYFVGPFHLSRDGEKIAYQLYYKEQLALDEPTAYPKMGMSVMNADGTGQRQLVDRGAVIGEFYWSPDGSKVLLTATKRDEEQDTMP